MNNLQKGLMLIGMLWLSGCSMHPLGINDDEWAVMSREEQLRAYEKQAELDKVRAEAQAIERAAQAEAEARKYEAMAQLRENAQYGDIVQCVLDPVQMKFRSDWKPAQPQAFDLVRGEQLTLRIQDRKDRYSSEARVAFAASGLEVELCRNNAYRYGGDCVRVLGTSRDFRRGMSKTFEIDRFMKGTLRCDLKPIRRL